MRSSRGAVGAAMLTAALALSACTGDSGTKAVTSATPAATAPPVASSLTTSPSVTTRPTTPKPIPTKTVPVDQIPPGNPASWVPAGVPTTAKYKEPGDVVPKFTQAIFHNSNDGANAAIGLYFAANNWDAATGFNPSIFSAICPRVCKQEIRESTRERVAARHIVGGRYKISSALFSSSNDSLGHYRIGTFKVSVTKGALYSGENQQIRTFKASSFKLEIDTRWSGKMWQLTAIYYVQ